MKTGIQTKAAGAVMAAASLCVASAQADRCQAQSAPAATLAQNRQAEAIKSGEVNFYRVPLVCPAAPQIGCGSASKPFLLDLERTNDVSEAWLNRAGTIIAVVWSDQATAKQKAGTVKAVLGGLPLNKLTGSAKEQALKDFQSGSGWYRGTEVDRLSEEEAGIIAARLVRRVQAKTTLPPEKAEALQRALTEALRKRFTDDKAKRDQDALLLSGDGLHHAVSEYLDKDQIPILKEVIASGLLPLSNEK